jgi:hypothetical protein
MIENQDLRNALLQAQKIADKQDPDKHGGVFRYPLNPALECDPSILSAEDEVEDIPIIYAEFRFLNGAWVFTGVKGF